MQQQISQRQLGFILYFQILGLGILIYPFAIGQSVVRDAWMIGLTFILSVVAITAVIVCFMKTFPNLTLIEGLHTAFGRWLGSTIAMWILFWIYMITCIDTLETMLFLNNTLFPNTPNYVITALFIFPVSYAVYMGLEVLGRLAEIVSPVTVALTIFLFLMAMRNANITNIQPVLADGLGPVLRGSMVPWAAGMKFIVTLFLAPSLQKGFRVGRTLLIIGTLVGLTGLFTELSTTLILGQTRTYSGYPILEVVRTIRIGTFVERLDTIYVTVLIATTFIDIIVLHYCIASGLKQLFQLKQYRPLVWSTGMLIWAGSMFFLRDSQTEKNFVLLTAPSYFYFNGIVIPVLAIAIHLFRRRKP